MALLQMQPVPMLYCGQPTKRAGHLCRWSVSAREPCKYHGTGADGISYAELLDRERHIRKEPPPASGTRIAAREAPTVKEERPRTDLEAAVSERRLQDVCWGWVERAAAAPAEDARWGSVAITALRLIAGMPADALTSEDAADQAYLRGKIMNGIPPETGDEWELATRMFTPDALAELESWNPRLRLLERNDHDVDQPLLLAELAGEQADAPGLVEGED